VQFSFREGVEPVYRELVALLLQPKGGVNGGEPSQENLLQARNVIESLQLAELVNFFGENCLSGNPVQIDQIDQKAAVIYPIILNDRLEVILSLPQQPLSHFATPLSQTQVESTVLELRNALRQEYSKKFLSVSQQVYDWLIRPIEADLAKSGVKTLVFLLDGSLRNIPMATLHDGKEYIVEKYALALTPGLQLLDPKPLVRQQIKVLTAGITEGRQDFSPLPNVELELKEIQAEVPSTVLLNQTFTSSNLQKEIKSSSFPVVHLATHGQFSSKAEDTFILTWDDRINIKQLNNVLKTRDLTESSIIELLVLSACQTAVGDKRAALGLAGMAVRAGARSTLASLWSVNDAATASFMIQFYQNLADNKVTKAEAVRRAQLSLLQNPEYSHPYFWAPFILVGNWL
jgi:CHAT domain-containing protein